MSPTTRRPDGAGTPDATGNGRVHWFSWTPAPDSPVAARDREPSTARPAPNRSSPEVTEQLPTTPADIGGTPPADRRMRHGRRPGPGQRRTTWRAVVVAFLLTVGFPGVAVGYSLLQPTVYGAQVEFILTPRPELSDAAVDRAMVTQTMLVQSARVLGPVATRTGMSFDALRDRVTVGIVGRSNVLRLTVGDRDQGQAIHLVELISARYVDAVNASTAAVVTTPSGDHTPAITPSLLTAASPLDHPLQPRPLRALAVGLILGLLTTAVVVTAMLRPRLFSRPTPYWD